jgi:hypothetical protein
LLVFETIEQELGVLVEIHRMDGHAAVVARAQGDPDRAVDGQRQDISVVVIRVFADQIDPAWGAHDPSRGTAETGLERGGNGLLA